MSTSSSLRRERCPGVRLLVHLPYSLMVAGKLLYDEVDIGLEQSQLDLAHRRIDVLLAYNACLVDFEMFLVIFFR